MALSKMLHLQTGSQKFKMAAAKPEVIVSQLLYKIAKKFDRLPDVFGVGELSAAIKKAPSSNRKSEIQDGSCQTGSTCISAAIQDLNDSRKPNTKKTGAGP